MFMLTSLIGVPGELLPHKAAVARGIDYSDASHALLKEIRPRRPVMTLTSRHIR
jgi:hypothetical protein